MQQSHGDAALAIRLLVPDYGVATHYTQRVGGCVRYGGRESARSVQSVDAWHTASCTARMAGTIVGDYQLEVSNTATELWTIFV